MLPDFPTQYDDLWPGVVNAAFSVLGRRGDAEEIAQDVFVRYWREPERFDARRGELGPYLRMIARSRALDHWRREQAASRARDRLAVKSYDTAVPFDEQPEAAAQHAELARILRTAVRALPDNQREALTLAYWGDLTADEVARRTCVPLGTAKSRIRIGLEKLRAEVATQLA